MVNQLQQRSFWLIKASHLIKIGVFLLIAYIFISIIYLINKPIASQIKEPNFPVSKQLNSKMLRVDDYKYLLNMKAKGIAPNKRIIQEYEDYFKLVVSNVNGQADAFGMLGYCQYYLNKESEAIRSFELALEIDPTFEGYYYNLAVIFYNKREYHKAIALLERRNTLTAQQAAKAIMSSQRVFGLALELLPGTFPQKIIDHLQQKNMKAEDLLQNNFMRLSNDGQASVHKKFLLEFL